jgi:circadian clock protein KaiB
MAGWERDSTEQGNEPPTVVAPVHYHLRLFVAGFTPRSVRALEMVRAVCEEYLSGHYELEVIDVYKTPESARIEQILAIPTLIRELPLPLRRLIGDLSNREKLLVTLNIGDATAG